MVTTAYTERDVLVRDLKLHYQEWGSPSAPAILMLHGFGVSGHMFDEFAARVQERYRLIALDQRGHGDSDWSPEGDYSRDAFVADFEGFREALGIDRFVLVGHSMGGLNAVAYAVRYPHRVSALVLVDVGPESAKEGVDNIVRFTRGPDELDFEEFVEMTHRFNPRRSIENIRERMRYRLRQMDSGKWTWKFDRRFRQADNGLRIGSELSNDESWQLFRRVTVPALLVRGAESDVLTPAVAERAAREMPRATLAMVPGAGHSVPGDNPDDFTAAVQGFLGDVESGTFAPIAAQDPPPLSGFVPASRGTRSRRPPRWLTLVLLGVGATVALASTLYVLRRGRGHKPALPASAKQAAVAAAESAASVVGRVDIERARRRTADLASELSGAGRSSLARARSHARAVDLDRARNVAREVLSMLGEQTRATPAAVRGATSRVDRQKLKRRDGIAAKAGRAARGTALPPHPPPATRPT
ncbi:MAG: alpha/beta fold hydrolase, partial [Tepidiformaceae bacterium]